MLEELNFFVMVGTLVGAYAYYLGIKKIGLNKKISGEDLFFICIGAFLGGILGAKILIWILNWETIINSSGLELFNYILNGRTIIGAIIGGFLGVEITKKCLGIKTSTGNAFAPALAIGVAIGRIGCYIKGCCYGKIAPEWLIGKVYMHDAWRYPTQIYEVIFHFTAFLIMWHQINKQRSKLKPGTLFPAYVFAYAIFRFFIEYIRGDTIPGFLGLTFFQIICLAGILIISGFWTVRYLKKKTLKK
jgi:phosphatidylglycerol:prolipoprotein diacylglycerol transferase